MYCNKCSDVSQPNHMYIEMIQICNKCYQKFGFSDKRKDTFGPLCNFDCQIVLLSGLLFLFHY